jgi:uncharacterized protein involved in response to NO
MRAAPLAIPLFARGFRPFFLLVAAHACLFVPLWLAVLHGTAPAPDWLDRFAWHGHEMVFGFATAAIAGFLLTAAPVWTGTTPVTGAALALLAALWVAGRVALLLAGVWPRALVAAVDLAFLPALAAALAPALLGPGRRRHGVFLLVLAALAGANALVHASALGFEVVAPAVVLRTAVELVGIPLVVIGGRITPAFTRNALGAEARVRATPRLDGLAAAGVAVMALSGLAPETTPLRTGAALAAGAAVLARLAGWQTARVLHEPLLWSLHAGQAWLGLGLVATGLAAWRPDLVPPNVALHALGAGAMGATILAVIPRVTLGHTGRPLAALTGTRLAFALVNAGAAARVVGPWLAPAQAPLAWWVGGGLWAAAFAIFLVRYGPLLTRPRVDGRAG